mgnify:CR=1 FL=1
MALSEVYVTAGSGIRLVLLLVAVTVIVLVTSKSPSPIPDTLIVCAPASSKIAYGSESCLVVGISFTAVTLTVNVIVAESVPNSYMTLLSITLPFISVVLLRFYRKVKASDLYASYEAYETAGLGIKRVLLLVEVPVIV